MNEQKMSFKKKIGIKHVLRLFASYLSLCNTLMNLGLMILRFSHLILTIMPYSGQPTLIVWYNHFSFIESFHLKA